MSDIGFADNVRETFSSTGTTITLAGAVDTFRAFSSVCVNGDTIYAAARKGSEFSFGKFTWGTGGTLTQTQVLYGTNGTSPVNFSAGTGEVISDVPAALLLALAYMAYAASVVSVGANRATNPALQLDFSAASAATGLKVLAAAAAAGVSLAAISSGTNENLKIDAKGSGTITIGGTSTGDVVLPTNIITSRTEDTSPDGAADFLLSYDASAGAFKKMLLHRATAVKVGTSTRDLTTASGSQAITGVGFKPKALIVFGNVNAATAMSAGLTDGSTYGAIFDIGAGAYGFVSTFLIVANTGGANQQLAALTSFDSDGFTLAWTKQSTPTGTFSFSYLAIR